MTIITIKQVDKIHKPLASQPSISANKVPVDKQLVITELGRVKAMWYRLGVSNFCFSNSHFSFAFFN